MLANKTNCVAGDHQGDVTHRWRSQSSCDTWWTRCWSRWPGRGRNRCAGSADRRRRWRTGPLASRCRCPLPGEKKKKIHIFQEFSAPLNSWNVPCDETHHMYKHRHTHTDTHTHTHKVSPPLVTSHTHAIRVCVNPSWLFTMIIVRVCVCESPQVESRLANEACSQYTCCVGVLPQVYKGGRLCVCVCVCVFARVYIKHRLLNMATNSCITFCYLAGNRCGSINRRGAGVCVCFACRWWCI